MRYLLDSDATPDKCTDPIWSLGLEHPGYESPEPAPVMTIARSFSTPIRWESVDSLPGPRHQRVASDHPPITGCPPPSPLLRVASGRETTLRSGLIPPKDSCIMTPTPVL